MPDLSAEAISAWQALIDNLQEQLDDLRLEIQSLIETVNRLEGV